MSAIKQPKNESYLNVVADHPVHSISAEDRIKQLEEQVASQQAMLERTTTFLLQTQAELRSKSEILKLANKELFDSISYGRHVQDAILASENDLNAVFKESFIWLDQRDNVGGDLPYFYTKNDRTVVAAVDCTGHGVAGAILTALVYSMLNEFLESSDFYLPSVLAKLNDRFINVFRGDGNGAQNVFGMDIAIVCFDSNMRTLQFAGAGRPLILIRDRQIHRFAKSGLGIGFSPNSHYSVETISVQSGDLYYLFTDGVVDQLGDAIPKKYSEARLRDLLLNVKRLRMNKQKEIIRDYLYAWQGKEPQTDDQLMIGFKPF